MSSITSETYGDTSGVENINLDDAISFVDNNFPKAETIKNVIEQCKMDKQAIMEASSKLKIPISKLSDRLTEPCLDVLDKINETRGQFDNVQADIESTIVKSQRADRQLTLNTKLLSTSNATVKQLSKDCPQDECMPVDISSMN